MTTPILYYFDMPGRAEAIRCAFVAGGIDFEDVRFSHFAWLTRIKKSTPGGKVPVLEVNGKKYTESRAILSYACSLSGNLPSTPQEWLSHNMIADRLEDIWAFFGSIYKAKMGKARTIACEKATANIRNFMADLDLLVAKHAGEPGHVLKGKPFCPADLLIYTTIRFLNARQFGVHVEDPATNYPHVYAIFRGVLDSNPLIQEYHSPSCCANFTLNPCMWLEKLYLRYAF
eukprot:Protomagalhaensia_wolfi_Nauph_80__2016@NODE_227_length_3123_cov_696_261673_g169_i0_p2_GENE_NODE_227_length_3123_cov_696_261673_g169_i0NODE_227_length_3123_cov_696_261673_g169_i0_p2_ORF_typecomplete_len230_score29_89GST_N/PF02798_20/1_5e12GST_N_3/PF13417_6/1e06GST_N_4/PF17172_4/0_0071_NODE_227_length_3123_cov_696_261673_g169_i010781767